MGANQSSNASFNSEHYPADNADVHVSQRALYSGHVSSHPCASTVNPHVFPLATVPVAAVSMNSAGDAGAINGQPKFPLSMACSPRSSKDLSHKGKAPNGKLPTCKEAVTSDEHLPHSQSTNGSPASTMDLARSSPARASILRGSFRRVKAPLANIPPPVIPDDKFNRLSNVSLGSSGFGGGSSQESTASSDSSVSSVSSAGNGHVMTSFAPASNGNSTTVGGCQPENPASRKARMNLKLNIVVQSTTSNPAVSLNGLNGNRSLDNPYAGQNCQTSSAVTGSMVKFNLPRSPMSSPLASPSFNPGFDAARHSPLPGSSDLTTAVHRPGQINPALSTGNGFRSSTFHPEAPVSVQVITGDSLKSPTASSSRSDYVELMCDPRHSRSSFSSFDGSSSNYSSSSFTNSPNSNPTLDINAMFHAGMNDNEVLSAWLGSIGFTEYFGNFIQAGYDMPSAVRMTTEDLTAIGITKPNHRKRIRAEIARLPCVDLNFGCDMPETAAQFLHAAALSEYLPSFLNQNYHSTDKILNMTWEDLEDVGVKKLGHLKKLTLAIKHFKALRRQTAQSAVLEDEARRLSSSSYVSHDSSFNLGVSGSGGAGDDDKSSSLSGTSSQSASRHNKQPLLPVLRTFQALPSSSKENLAEVAWRPRSAMNRHPSPLALSPDSEEICVSWNGSSQRPAFPLASSDQNGSLSPSDSSPSVMTNDTCTLPRRKSTKSGGKSIAKMLTQVFRSDKVPSTPPSPKKGKDQTDSAGKPQIFQESRSSPTKQAPLANYVSTKVPPPSFLSRQSSSSPSRRPSPVPFDIHEMGSLSHLPPPPSPLLRDYSPRGSEIDTEKTPTLPHRTLLPAPMNEINPGRTHLNGHGDGRKPSQSSLPFAQDNIGTIRQKFGRNIPVLNSLTFCDPKTMSLNDGQCSDEVLDEITGMLANLTDELDEAMCQLESVAH